ncbi:YqaJ-like viral recombinase domain protein [Ruminiclostridium hungatei]|uniref:YqaJ-like viral recombinase domain protein n=1 Tax=Ruminiclostridium hungatei TaxID=48256 RepID=A0A1V4SR60_RUMHU|nr:YqaJ viral recombinase family protein [Ruminiclostridium hungatei]OPX46352.1 YqaJ-like viral recombinase domain protein [Ruminiclostridium hungatei]
MNTESITRNINILSDVRTLSNEQWLTVRKTGIGGSEIAALFGKSNYASPLSIYMDKMSDEIRDESSENEFLEWGKTLEPLIREKFPAKFKKTTGIDIEVREFPYIMQSLDCQFMLANIDGLVAPQQDYKFNVQVSDGEWEECFIPAGLTGILEIKTGSGFTAKNWKENSLPDNYFLQTQSYLGITGLSYAFVVALIDKHLLWRYIPRDDEIITIIKERVHEFWTENILKKVPPAPIGSDIDTGILKSMYPQELKDKALNLDHMADKRIRYKQLAEEIKNLQKEQDTIKQEFMSVLGDAEVGFCGDKKVSWKMQAGSTYTVTRQPQRILRIG